MAIVQKELALTFDDVLLRPVYSEISSRKDTDVSSYLTPGLKLATPIISANMDTVTELAMALAMAQAGGAGVLHRFMPISDQIHIVQTVKARGLPIGASIGVQEGEEQSAADLIDAGVDFIVVDIAHAHSKNVSDIVSRLKSHKLLNRVPFIGGNVATAEGAEFLAKLGFSAVKVGIGSGSICTTRVVTGFGVPQLTAVMECSEICKKYDVKLIADGGIRTSGDIVKALAAGADVVMLGSMLAGTDESPGRRIMRNGSLWKHVRGMASTSANISRKALTGVVTEEYISSITPEGVEAMVPYRGSVNEIMTKLVGGIRSGLSYAGAHTIKELQRNAVFVPITNAGLRESHAHDVIV